MIMTFQARLSKIKVIIMKMIVNIFFFNDDHFSGGIVSYSMPQGDKRGSTYEFYDWNYDGQWRGER